MTIDLHIAGAASAEDIPLFAASERGLFAKVGLTAEFAVFPSGVEAVKALAAGTHDLAVIGTFAFLVSVARGVSLRLIGHNEGRANAFEQSDVLSVVGRSNAGVRVGDLRSLMGVRIALPRGSGAEPYLLGLLRQSGLSMDDVRIDHALISDLPRILASSEADAIVGWEPWTSLAVSRAPGAVRVIAGGCRDLYGPRNACCHGRRCRATRWEPPPIYAGL
jgi:ABC-type nitrate/sulfonate/bicarbonate transport system substrate-binding protein